MVVIGATWLRMLCRLLPAWSQRTAWLRMPEPQKAFVDSPHDALNVCCFVLLIPTEREMRLCLLFHASALAGLAAVGTAATSLQRAHSCSPGGAPGLSAASRRLCPAFQSRVWHALEQQATALHYGTVMRDAGCSAVASPCCGARLALGDVSLIQEVQA
jgi:hypothetical protein